MKVGGPEIASVEGGARLSMRIQWEDLNRPDEVLWFEWTNMSASDVTCELSTALLAAYPLAMWSGERRVAIDGEVCPRLVDNSRTAMALISSWVPQLRPPVLEVVERAQQRTSSGTTRRAGLCLSGGVDALTALHLNLRTVPTDHPARFRDALFLFGLNSYDFVDGVANPLRVAAYASQQARLATVCADAGVTLVGVSTNVRAMYPSFEAWSAVAHGSPLAAVAHAMCRRLGSLAIANAGAGIRAGVVPHPLMDAFYASHDVDVYALHVMLPRLEKVRMLAEWPDGLAALRVCYMIDLPTHGSPNCGRCEKCIRTMLELIAVGALDRAPFPERDVTPDAIEAVSFDSLAARIFFAECAPALEMRGRSDLARTIRTCLDRHDSLHRERVGGSRGWWRRWR